MQPVLTVAEMKAVDAAGPASTPLDVLVRPGGPGRGPGRPGHARRRLRAAGGGGRRPGQQRRRRPGGGRLLRRRGARVGVVEAGTATTLGPADLVIDAAYGTGFRGEYRAPARAPGTPVLAVDIPSGVRGRHRGGLGSPRAGRPHGHLRGPQARPAPGRRGPAGRPGVGGRHRPPGGPPDRLGDGGRRRRPPAPAPPLRRQQVVGRRAGGGRVAGHDRCGRPLCPVGLPGRGRDGPPRRARRATSPGPRPPRR